MNKEKHQTMVLKCAASLLILGRLIEGDDDKMSLEDFVLYSFIVNNLQIFKKKKYLVVQS